RSPGGAPRPPRPPCPLSRILDPESTPGGTVMSTFFFVRTSPAPPQVGHGSDGMLPRPRHMGHGRLTAKPPCPNEITPRPLHSGQVREMLPGAAPLPLQVAHSSVTSSSTGTLPPRAATRNGISSVVSTDCPTSGAERDRPPARPLPPNIDENMSLKPPIPPISKSSIR